MSELRRDRGFEHQCAREVVGDLGVNVEPLIAMAFARADRGEQEYGHDFPDPNRDMLQNALEELADCHMYGLWELDKIRRGLSERDIGLTQLGLKHAALAFAAFRAVANDD